MKKCHLVEKMNQCTNFRSENLFHNDSRVYDSSSYTFKPISLKDLGGMSFHVFFIDRKIHGRFLVNGYGENLENNHGSFWIEDAIAEAWTNVSAHQRIIWKKKVKDHDDKKVEDRNV